MWQTFDIPNPHRDPHDASVPATDVWVVRDCKDEDCGRICVEQFFPSDPPDEPTRVICLPDEIVQALTVLAQGRGGE